MSVSVQMFAIRSKIGANFEYVTLTESELRLPVFIKKALDVHKIIPNESTMTQIFDWNRTPIRMDVFPTLIRQFIQNKDFYIEIDVSNLAVRAKCESALYNYLKKNDTAAFFIERDRNHFLSPKTERKMLTQVMGYMKESYGLNATDAELLDIALAVVTIFPSMKANPSNRNGVESLYDPDKRCGKLYEKLVYQRRNQKVTNQGANGCADDDNEMDDEERIENLLTFFKGCVLPRDTKDLLNQLKDTAVLRLRNLSGDRKIFHSSFHLYKVQPKLISHDFKILFAETDSNLLIDRWPNIRKNPQNLLSVSLGLGGHFSKSSDLYDVLTFLKVLPTHQTKFENAIKALVVISTDSTVDPVQLMKGQTDAPRIIAIFSDESNASKYYIWIEKSVISLPVDFMFINAFDFYFKAIKVFNLEVDKALTQFMGIVGHFMYNIRTSTVKLTPTSKKTANILFPIVEE